MSASRVAYFLLYATLASCAAVSPKKTESNTKRKLKIASVKNRSQIVTPIKLVGNFYDVELNELKNAPSFEVTLKKISIQEQESFREKLTQIEQDGTSNNRRLIIVPKQIKTPEFFKALGLDASAELSLKLADTDAIYSTPLAQGGDISIEDVSEGEDAPPFSFVRVKKILLLRNTPHPKKGVSEGIAFLAADGEHPFNNGIYSDVKFSAAEPFVSPKIEKLISDIFSEMRSNLPESLQGAPLKGPIQISSAHLNAHSRLRLIYATIGDSHDSRGDIHPVTFQYLLGILSKEEKLDVITQRSVTSSYSSSGISVKGGFILKDGRYLLKVPPSDAWQCPEVLIIRDNGEVESRQMECEPSSC